ncbi:hypothetical protein [Nocardia huaxiensis]|uniref:Uncharacterized protein n=1 Tax=Nocardia huaxiensis TaxID=2755382 RepID=A0A7D6Z994_9NOCA|nr:hypothetical protein [Nocardia huaxiensis]QLY28158.1 hypothetical protein H0264_22485 [Nocardia huaxiensis]UFS98396.1 hypothetical protein LPY97_11090 [Nocardia huaxiensis]
MVTPNSIRSCTRRPHVATPSTPRSPDSDRRRRMQPIVDLERAICALELPRLGHSLVSDHAVTQVLDSTTLAVVMHCGHNVAIVEEAIREQHLAIKGIDIDRDMLVVSI